MNDRSHISNNLNLTVAGRVATFENKSKSEAAASASALTLRMMRTWSNVFDYGTKLRADTSRPEIERERLLAQFASRQIDALSPAVTSAMNRLNERRQIAQDRIDALHAERDTLAATRGAEARAFLRSLPELERMTALSDPMLAKAAASAPARLSGLKDDAHVQVREAVAARELPDAIAEIADLDAGTELLMMASHALIANTAAWTDQETARVYVAEAPADQVA